MKRFTDTSKWKDSWFQDLPTKYKLFWIYILDECDAAGVWKPNIRLASFQIGEPFEESELKRIFADRLDFTESGYWFLKKFVFFQYGKLSESCKPHLSVINLLKYHKIKGYTKGIHTLEEKEKDKEQDKEEEQEKENYVTVANEIINHVKVLEFYEAQLNGTQSEYSLPAWKPLVNNWFLEHLQENFQDNDHLKNSFKKWYINRKPKTYQKERVKLL
jgi:hypothetical protein